MLPNTFFGTIFLAMSVLAPVASATASDKYGAYNQCGAPFCGSTGNAAGAGAVARIDRYDAGGTLNDKPVRKRTETRSKV